MLVYIHSSYKSPELFRQTPGLDGVWDDIRFTYEEVEECDYVIVINHPVKDLKVKCRKGGRILLIQEPPYERNKYLIPFFPYFDKIISGFDKSLAPAIMDVPAALPWLIDKNYTELAELLPEANPKKDALSWVTSNSNMNPGHEPRLKFLDKLKQSDLPVDLFGRGIQPLPDKFDGLYPYKYTLAVENYSARNYWTEKIADAYLSWSMPVYYGCENIEDFFPEDSFIRINIHEPEAAMEIIKKSIAGKRFDKNLEAIREARLLVLNRYQFFPFMTELIRKEALPESYIHCTIPVSPYSKGVFSRIKSLLRTR